MSNLSCYISEATKKNVLQLSTEMVNTYFLMLTSIFVCIVATVEIARL